MLALVAKRLLLLIVCSPSGAGKTTLTRHLLSHVENLTFSVSHTTRPQRPAERDGRDYHFVDRTTFEAMVAADRFVEWAEVHGNLYGTCSDELERVRADGFDGVVFDIDHQGARQLRAKLPEAVGIFVLPPSVAELRRRLEARASDTKEVIERRMRKALDEVEHYPFFDYLIVNEDLRQAKAAIESIARAELCKRWRLAASAESLLRHHSIG